jgi:hypothetical protein
MGEEAGVLEEASSQDSLRGDGCDLVPVGLDPVWVKKLVSWKKPNRKCAIALVVRTSMAGLCPWSKHGGPLLGWWIGEQAWWASARVVGRGASTAGLCSGWMVDWGVSLRASALVRTNTLLFCRQSYNVIVL